MALYRNTRTGAVRSFSVNAGYPWVLDAEAEDDTEIADRTIEAIMKDVGDDAALAAVALTHEKARETPRVTLIARLEAIIEAAEAS